MHFDELLQFLEHDMRMSQVYQPVMLRELLARGGKASREKIARVLLNAAVRAAFPTPSLGQHSNMRINPAGAIAAVFLCAAISAPAQALPPGQYHNYGAGIGSCGVWLTDRKSSDSHAATLDLLWVLGWVSAAGYYNGQPLRDTDSQAIAAWVDKYCRENPLNKIADAAKSLVETLAKPE